MNRISAWTGRPVPVFTQTRTLLLAAVILAAYRIPAARAELIPIRAYNTADGLAEDRVNAILCDRNGFVWVVTSAGLSKFDGYRFTTWSDKPYRGGSALVASSAVDYWFGSGKGLRHFQAFGPERGGALAPPGQIPGIEDIVRTRSGHLFAATAHGVYQVHDNPPVFTPVPISVPAQSRISALAEDQEGDVWVAAGPAVARFFRDDNPAEGRSIPLPAAVTNLNAMVEAPTGTMWIATNAGLARLDRLPSGEWTFGRMFGVSDGLAGPEVLTIFRSSSGEVWAGTRAGVSRFPEREFAQPHFNNLGVAQGLTDSYITALAEDASGNIWAGTESAGVMRIGAHGFTTFQEDNGLKAASLSQVLQARDGAMMAVGDSGTRPERLYTVFDGKSFHQNPATAIGSRIPWTWQRMLLQDSSGEWWATTTHGFCRFDAVSAAALAAAPAKACYTNESIYHIFADSRDNLWASAIGDRLLRFNKATGKTRYICQDASESDAPCAFGALVPAIAEDHAGNVWLGLRNGQIECYRQGQLVHFSNIEKNMHGSIASLLIDADGDLWVAHYGSGLTRISSPGSDASRLTTWDTSNGAPSDNISSMVQDNFGDIWAGTARGVIRLNPRTGAIRRYSMTDGLPQAVFRSAIRDRDGAIWFATSRGLARILPEPETRSDPPPVLLTGIRIGGDEFPVSQLGEKRVPQVVLEPGRNHVEVEFAAMGAAFADDQRYRFMLSGADTDWSSPQRDHRVDYRHLLAGTYRFLVKSVGADGSDSASVAEFDFRILPPLWLRWWFELAAAILIATTIYSLHRYRVSHLVAIERMRTDIAIDLHDDIGASLARIAVLSEVARASLERDHHAASDAAAAPLARIGITARELVDSLNDIVWSIRARDSGADSLISRMRDFALDALAQSGAAFTLNCDESIRGKQIPPDIRRHVLLIFKEAIHNIARHSGATAARTELRLSAGMLIMSVSDDGKGRTANGSAAPRGGNGIPGMMRRARAMGGEIEFGATSAGGCLATLKVPVGSTATGGFRRR